MRWRYWSTAGPGGAGVTVRVADCEPGAECQVDFGRMGLLADPAAGHRRVVHALIFTAVYSRHCYVHLSFRQDLPSVIAGCEAAWAFFGGIFKIIIPDNMSAIVDRAHPLEPRISRAFAEYAQDRGFLIDPARVRSPQDKPRVERMVQFVRGSFFAGEDFAGLPDAQRRARMRGAPGGPGSGSTAPRSAGPPSCSPPRKHRGCCRRRSCPMTCRRMPPRRCTVITTSKSRRPCTRCPAR